MKKIIILALAAFSLEVSAQMSIQVTNITNTNSPVVIAANSDIFTATHPYITSDLTFDIKNTSATASNTYIVKRYDILRNHTAMPDTAIPHFCFAGQCYLTDTRVSPSVGLQPGQSTSELQGLNFVLDAELDEASVIGLSQVKYTIMNTATHSDSLQFTIKYNYTETATAIKEINKTISSFEIFPNPAKETTSILISSPKAFESNVMLYNSLGEVVYQKDLSVTEGKNTIDLNVGNLPAGVYFASIKTAGNTITKKLIVN